MFHRAVTWWTFFRISLEERLVYRGDFALGTLMRFLPIVTQIFLWYAIFSAVAGGRDEVLEEDGQSTAASQDAEGEGESAEQNATQASDAQRGESGDSVERDAAGQPTIEDYTFRDMVAYYLLAMLTRAFSSMPGLTTGIALQIQTGEVKKYLIQPVDMVGCLLLQRVAHKLVYYFVAAAPFALVFFLCRGYFEQGWPSPDVLAAFLASLVMAFLLGYFLEACMGLVGFWFLEITSLTFIYMLLSFFLSGHMFPLDLLPQRPINFQALVDLLPFKFLAYFPAAVFLGKVEGDELARDLWILGGWVAFFIVLARVLWSRGVRRYSGFGG